MTKVGGNDFSESRLKRHSIHAAAPHVLYGTISVLMALAMAEENAVTPLEAAFGSIAVGIVAALTHALMDAAKPEMAASPIWQFSDIRKIMLRQLPIMLFPVICAVIGILGYLLTVTGELILDIAFYLGVFMLFPIGFLPSVSRHGTLVAGIRGLALLLAGFLLVLIKVLI